MNSKLLIGGLLAAAAGIAIGVLLSPAGEGARKKLMEGFGKLKDSKLGKSLKEGYNQKIDAMANKEKEMIESTAQKVKA